jgi:hypothetical protein
VTNDLKRLAADKLPACHSLADAERCLGGRWNGSGRDKVAAAEAWGMYDGYRGLPTPSGDVLNGCRKLYDEAYRVGQGIAGKGKG